MSVFHTKILLITIVTLKYLPAFQKDERQRWLEYCHDDNTKCPNCFDETIKSDCDNFLDKVEVESSFDLEVSSLFGNRKIQYATYDQQNVILKYLVSDGNFDHLQSKCCNGSDDCEHLWKNKSLVETLKTELMRVFKTKHNAAGFQICPTDAVTRFMEVFSDQKVNSWVLLNLNVEPLVVNALSRRNFSVPKLLGLCGFVTLQSNNGLPLYSFYDQSFAVRLLIAKNLLSAALEFSYGVEGFRIYLTDATADNIVVDATTFDVTFVDLDDVFVVDSTTCLSSQVVHRHEKIDCDGMCFAYVPDELCSYHLSDINLFAICQLFVKDVNRMPDYGLLHSVPDTISTQNPELQQLINQCIDGNIDGDRFVTVKLLLELINKVLFN
ncbi:hypothetical protein HA402_005058 [Bradysia odoriphaga]|nr:hypothetical protein HA402_005058 [Bradysia odoriphaga]